MKPAWRYLAITLACLTLAALLRFWIAPASELLPAGYTFEAKLTVDDKFRDSPTSEWQMNTLIGTRIDQAIPNTNPVAIIEGSMHVYFATGAVNFESSSLYGVDRRSRENQPGYGTSDRSGQYLFPPHVQQRTYPLWDPMFIGLRQATFARTENLQGLLVYVFDFKGSGMDETAGYSFLPDVPDRYLTFTDGLGTLWIEPLSGTLLNYTDQGVSYFVDSATKTRLPNGEFHRWSQSFFPETMNNQLAAARTARLRILLLEDWLPGGMLLAGLVSLAWFLFRRKNNLPTD